MGFLSGLVGGKNTFSAGPATGATQFQGQYLLDALAHGQTGFEEQLKRTQGVGTAQGELAKLLLAQAQGAGPNIAQQQLEQATNRNIQQGAGLIASQRGMNPALAARLIANQTAAANQQAAGQSGLMRAQQQLATQGLLNNVYGSQAQTELGAGQLANQNLNINQVAQANQNAQVIGAKNAANQINAQVAAQNQAQQQNALGGLFSGIGTVASGFLGGNPASGGDGGTSANNYNGSGISPMDRAMLKLHSGGDVPSFIEGGHVPGKASVEGDSVENDTVDAKLSPGEVVLPRSVTKAPDAPDRAKEFMKAILKEKSQEAEPKGYAKILEMERRMKEAHSHLDDLHKMLTKKNA